jgi:ADP-ribose pyrophosphatase YjhB (NUDIX family)
MEKPHIESFTHCPVCGSGDFPLLPDQTRSCGSCGYHDFNNPIVAVAALIINDKNQMLMIRRGKDPRKGFLAMPGGFVDVNETVEHAVCREIKEEIGLELSELKYLCSHPNEYVYQHRIRPVCDIFFQARVSHDNVVLSAEEVASCEWVTVASIRPEELAFESMRYALKALRDLSKVS